MGLPELCNVLLRDAGGVGGADVIPACAAAIIGGHHSVVALRLVVSNPDNTVPFGVTQGPHVLLANLHLQIGGAHVVGEVRQHRRKVLFCLPIRRVVLKHHREGLAVAAGRLEINKLVPRRIVRLAVHAAPLHPDDANAPPLVDLVDEHQRFLTLLAGILEEGVNISRELTAVGVEDLAQHLSASSATADADLSWSGDEVGIHKFSSQPIASPAGVIRKSGVFVFGPVWSRRGSYVTIENMMLTIHRVPEIVLNTGTDYKILAGFALTALAVLAGSWATAYTFKKTVVSQEEIATAGAIRSSRQAWINELRDACANHVAAVMQISDLRTQRDQWLAEKRVHMTPMAAYQYFENENPHWTGYSSTAVHQARMLRAKVELLLNPDEQETVDLLASLDATYDGAANDAEDLSDLCEVVVSRAQKIIKAEWRRTKLGK